jgi:hypothetical protein
MLLSADPDLQEVSAIVTDGLDLYIGGGSGGVGRIWLLPLSGGATTRRYSAPWTPSGGSCAVSLALLGPDLFWIDPNSGPITDTQILRAPKSGAGPVTAIYTGSLVGQPIIDGEGLTTNGIKLFTADAVQGRVHTLNPDGSELSLLGTRYSGLFETEHTNRLADGDLVIFVADGGKLEVGIPPQVVSIPKAGGAFTPLHVGAPFGCPNGITVGNDFVFVADPCANTLWSLPQTGGPPSVVVSGLPFVRISGVTFFDNALYVTDTGNLGPGKVYKVSPAPGPPLSEPEAFLTHLYWRVLGRAPDRGGLQAFLQQLQQFGSLVPTTLALFHSFEFMNRHTSDEQFLTLLYRAFLNREPDSTGFNAFLTDLQSGIFTRDNLLDIFLDSQEFAAQASFLPPLDPLSAFVITLYVRILGRGPDQPGLQSFLALLQQTRTALPTVQIFLHSPEFLARSTTNTDFVTLLYRVLLDRVPDAPGRAIFVSLLTQGSLTRDQLVAAFAASLEFQAIQHQLFP